MIFDTLFLTTPIEIALIVSCLFLFMVGLNDESIQARNSEPISYVRGLCQRNDAVIWIARDWIVLSFFFASIEK